MARQREGGERTESALYCPGCHRAEDGIGFWIDKGRGYTAITMGILLWFTILGSVDGVTSPACSVKICVMFPCHLQRSLFLDVSQHITPKHGHAAFSPQAPPLSSASPPVPLASKVSTVRAGGCALKRGEVACLVTCLICHSLYRRPSHPARMNLLLLSLER